LKKVVKLHDDGAPRTKHVTTNLVIEVDAAAGRRSRARIHGAAADWRRAAAAIVAGRYHDRFVRDGGACGLRTASSSWIWSAT